MASKADTNQKPKDITNPDVVTKFNAASEITQSKLINTFIDQFLIIATDSIIFQNKN
jgi:hypothetical protein